MKQLKKKRPPSQNKEFVFLNYFSWFSFMHSGIPRLIKLCRSPAERNNSDSVLVACLVGTFNFSFMPDLKKKQKTPQSYRFQNAKYCRMLLNSCQDLLLFLLSIILYSVNYLSSDWRYKHIWKNGFIFTLLSTKNSSLKCFRIYHFIVLTFHSVMLFAEMSLESQGQQPFTCTHTHIRKYLPKAAEDWKGDFLLSLQPAIFCLSLQDNLVFSQGVANRRLTLLLLRRKIPAAGPALHGL